MALSYCSKDGSDFPICPTTVGLFFASPLKRQLPVGPRLSEGLPVTALCHNISQ